jgi:hypothetical protein
MASDGRTELHWLVERVGVVGVWAWHNVTKRIPNDSAANFFIPKKKLQTRRTPPLSLSLDVRKKKEGILKSPLRKVLGILDHVRSKADMARKTFITLNRKSFEF